MCIHPFAHRRRSLQFALIAASRRTRAHFVISSSSWSRSASGELPAGSIPCLRSTSRSAGCRSTSTDSRDSTFNRQRRRGEEAVRNLRDLRDGREVAAHVVAEPLGVIARLDRKRRGRSEEQHVAIASFARCVRWLTKETLSLSTVSPCGSGGRQLTAKGIIQPAPILKSPPSICKPRERPWRLR